jgi:hypothetical protein
MNVVDGSACIALTAPVRAFTRIIRWASATASMPRAVSSVAAMR